MFERLSLKSLYAFYFHYLASHHRLPEGLFPQSFEMAPTERQITIFGFCGQHLDRFLSTHYECITGTSMLRYCAFCHHEELSCADRWSNIMDALRGLGKQTTMPKHVSDFASFLKVVINLDLRSKDLFNVVDGIQGSVDPTLSRLRKRYPTLSFQGRSTTQALLLGAIRDMGYRRGKACQILESRRQLYTSVATVLCDSPGPDPALPTPMIRNPFSLRISGEVTLAMIMLSSCWFYEYIPSSISSVLMLWIAWLPSRQSGDDCTWFNPDNHRYPTVGPHDARDELDFHKGRGTVNFALRSLLPRSRLTYKISIETFRDLMAFRVGLPIADCTSSDTRDICAFIQTVAQLVGMTNPAETRDIWSGQPLMDLGRLGLFIRQVKHLVVCEQKPRSMAIIYCFLYSLTSPRHNPCLRELEIPDKLDLGCSPTPFCGSEAPPCELDSLTPVVRSSPENPLRVLLDGITAQGLGIEEWQSGIDDRLRLCHEWSLGLHERFGPYDPVEAAKDVAPLCIRIMMGIAKKCGIII